MNTETKLFSTMAVAGSQWDQMLIGSTNTPEAAALRKAEYQKVFSTYESLRDAYKAFSGMAEVPLLSNQYFNATVASYVRSFAGFLTIERAMDQPTALLWYMDLLGVTDNRKVLPNLGAEDLNGINARFSTEITYAASNTVTTNKKLIPGSVEIQLVKTDGTGDPIIIRDDRQGNLLAPAGVLAPNGGGTIGVNYMTGVITFTNGTAIATPGDYNAIIKGFEDVAGDPAFGQLTGPGNNRFKVQLMNVVAVSEPDMLVAENNLMAIANMQKAVGANPADVTAAKLTELYTKLINQKEVNAIKNMWNGNAYTIDLQKANNNWTDYQSYLDKFMAELVNVDTELGYRSYKGIHATAYVVGQNVGNLFMRLKSTGNFVMNTDSTYVNDLLGYYNGIPVLRHNDIDANDGFAVVKTADGQAAPVLRGIFLPLTNTPIVGNYNNPSQMASGVYYQESNNSIFPELLQKFTVAADF